MIQAEKSMKTRMQLYWQLVRMDKPIGILLLLWPTLCALWIAAEGKPPVSLVLLFTLGTVLMRSAGCAINDFADRDIDRYVKRTAMRPLTSGQIKPAEAIWVAVALSAVSFLLVLSLNALTIGLSFVALFVAATYPWFKRFFALPQAYLGIAFGFGIPMAFAAVQNTVPVTAWLLLLGNVFWSLAYDTEYAMVDRDDRYLYLGHHVRQVRCGGGNGLLCRHAVDTAICRLAGKSRRVVSGGMDLRGLLCLVSLPVDS